ncbi:MAG: hypothetical protein KAS67_04275, partial [Thermoplasmata archaeon]|nr:hypothetical protein [Thermoplasmata archaeon]
YYDLAPFYISVKGRSSKSWLTVITFQARFNYYDLALRFHSILCGGISVFYTYKWKGVVVKAGHQ